jgi:tetratricopeptide (TPR) repeat protein
VLATLLVVVAGILVWTFWPASAQQLFRDGAKLMDSPHQSDWNRAFRDYFEPLQERYPDHPYEEELRRFRAKLESSRKPEASEAKRFFLQGERLRQEGQFKSAQQVWQNVVVAFGDCEAEQVWVKRSRQALQELEKAGGGQDRWHAVRPALQKAAALAAEGRRAEAEQTWKALEELYRDDPFAADLLAEIAKARSP